MRRMLSASIDLAGSLLVLAASALAIGVLIQSRPRRRRWESGPPAGKIALPAGTDGQRSC